MKKRIRSIVICLCFVLTLSAFAGCVHNKPENTVADETKQTETEKNQTKIDTTQEETAVGAEEYTEILSEYKKCRVFDIGKTSERFIKR